MTVGITWVKGSVWPVMSFVRSVLERLQVVLVVRHRSCCTSLHVWIYVLRSIIIIQVYVWAATLPAAPVQVLPPTNVSNALPNTHSTTPKLENAEQAVLQASSPSKTSALKPAPLATTVTKTKELA